MWACGLCVEVKQVVARGVQHPPEVRAGVVAALVTGAPLGDVCREFNVPVRTAQDWRDAAVASSHLVRVSGDEARTRRELDLEQLVGDLVSSSISALVAQAGFASERDWFTAQNASGIAEYRGVEFDRLIRLLRAFQREPDRPADQPAITDGAVVDATTGTADDGAGV